MSQAENKTTNRLARATSPYLLQHAHNPVDWFEWGPEVLEKATKENKPILVSIGYSSCHWCHVMERECFENPYIAAVMNEHLVCIKVDREERPDIDHVYMDAVQAMGVNGGWPLNVFLTPEQKPFYGGTYFPPQQWQQLITQLSKAFKGRRGDIDQSAAELAQHLNASEIARFANAAKPFNTIDFNSPFEILTNKFDGVHGGLDKAPKFVMPTLWMWLLRYHDLTKNKEALEMVLLTLRQLADGGIYDQIGGGFSRYSVDGRWFAPHFEKMLYDNAQLISLYSEAYRVSPDPMFRKVVLETVDWLSREMKHPEGGFYSALDADSEGIEGKFYTWTDQELDEALGSDAAILKQFYQTTEDGNWEHGRNILFRTGARETDMDHEHLTLIRKKLLQERDRRVRPSLDDKIVAGWNALLAQGLAEAYKTFGESSLLEEAISILHFVETRMMDGARCFRTFKSHRSTTEGFLEDYAHLIAAYLAVYESTFDESWIRKAEKLCIHTIDQFRDDKDGFFNFSGSSAEQLIARKKELFDNVIPSSNSVMARNLFRLGIAFDQEDWKQKAVAMTTSLGKLILGEPSHMSNWGILAMEITASFHEIVITGPNAGGKRKDLASRYLPFCLMMGTSTPSNLPLVKERFSADKTLIHVCVNKSCRLPVESVEEAMRELTSPVS